MSNADRHTPPFTPEEVALLIDRAGRAPSIHNTQPWRFAVHHDVIEVHADPRRSLPVADPDGRERTISCGAAVLNLRLTLGHLGYQPQVSLLPDGPEGACLAAVRRGPRRSAGAGDEGRYAAICRRRTQRRPFEGRLLTEPQRRLLTAAAAAENSWLAFLDGAVPRRQVARLMATAVARDAADPAYRAELNTWIRSRAATCDGIPLPSLGAARYPVDGLPRQDPVAGVASERDVDDELSRATSLVLGTLRDTPRDWLEVGQGMQRLLLTATAAGLVCAFANQLTELPDLRAELNEVLAPAGYPQLLLRVGHPLVDVPATPRRDAAQLFG